MDSNTLIDRIDDLLPQTQCARCGYPACRPYAEAIALADASINRCPPGGEKTISDLSNLLGLPVLPLDLDCGEAEFPPPIASIDERACIGCTLCIPACPVDAIIGAKRWMHTVLGAECTGCALCIDPCPMDCIHLIPRDSPLDQAEDPWRERWEKRRRSERAPRAKRSYLRHLDREKTGDLAFRRRSKRSRPSKASKPTEGAATPRTGIDDASLDIERRRAVIAAALKRERARRSPSLTKESFDRQRAGDKA
nr:RnfABCDGE type electron transport complex subunit B [Thioalkalivibrio sp. HK1]